MTLASVLCAERGIPSDGEHSCDSAWSCKPGKRIKVIRRDEWTVQLTFGFSTCSDVVGVQVKQQSLSAYTKGNDP